jgi:hypothetical protein
MVDLPPPNVGGPVPTALPGYQQQAPADLVAVLHRFKRGRRYHSLVVYRSGLAVVKTAPGFGGLLGPLLALVWSGRRMRKLDRIAPLGPVALAEAFPAAELVPEAAITHVQVRSGTLTQRIITIHHNNGQPPVHLPFPKGRHPLLSLWNVLQPVFGTRFVVDADVAAAG